MERCACAWSSPARGVLGALGYAACERGDVSPEKVGSGAFWSVLEVKQGME